MYRAEVKSKIEKDEIKHENDERPDNYLNKLTNKFVENTRRTYSRHWLVTTHTQTHKCTQKHTHTHIIEKPVSLEIQHDLHQLIAAECERVERKTNPQYHHTLQDRRDLRRRRQAAAAAVAPAAA